ncbi:formate dehydrogenase accessory sulfurtransferase FdhD [Candidatus Palauibacter sp.]|uniref:formate dehydrogenase accessory sulfurtransferase FdhD n=1 Tax=Candidatus Palauibacter sp. TaxID=3101350 RepID=UPI003B5AB440
MISPRRNTARVDIDRVSDTSSRRRRDAVAVEEPLEIRIATDAGEEHQVAVTMRTPGDDFDLTAGFLFSEGLLAHRSDVADLRYCVEVETQEYNIVTVQLSETGRFDPAELTRNFYTTSSCGVCGKASLEAIEIRGCAPIPAEGPTVTGEIVRSLPEALRSSQPVFERTGGLHAAGLFDVSGELQLLREDVGRHNALDKVIGERFLNGGLPLGDAVLAVSGRASFEIMQKALAAGIPIVVAVGAPSSLAVDVAKEFGMTLAGFAKPTGFNVYTGRHRVR